MRKLVISPQAGLGNRLRALCSAKAFGQMIGRDVYHFWVNDPVLIANATELRCDHVNEVKSIDPSYFFDLKIPLFDGDRVDCCFTEWMPGDGWYDVQSTAQSRLQCDHITRLGNIQEIVDCEDEVILLETSMETHLAGATGFRRELMANTYRAYFHLRPAWRSFFDSVPHFDNGIAVRRGDLIQYVPTADVSLEKMCDFIDQLKGTKILFSDDAEYLNELRARTNCLMDVQTIQDGRLGIDRAFSQFIVLSKCRKVFGTKHSSFAEQASLFGDTIFEAF